MVFILKNGASEDEIKAIEDAIYKNDSFKGFDAKKYNGKIPLKNNPLTIQIKLRNEWEKPVR